MNSQFTEIPKFPEEIENTPDIHSVTTISFGELLLDKVIRWDEVSNRKDEELTWNWIEFVYCPNNSETGKPDYDIRQTIYDRLCKKIERRYFNRELSVLPIWQWKREFIRTLGEIMPKYNKLYAIIDNINILQKENKYGKKRSIKSEFPQTLLNNNSDYASNGKDFEYEDVFDGDILEKIRNLNLKYKDVDVMVLDELEVLFCPFLAVNVNAY